MILIQKLKAIVSKFVLLLSFLTPRERSKWVFIAGNGSRFAENAKYLFLHCAESREDVTPVWISTSEAVVGELRKRDFSAHLAGSLRGRVHLLTAGVAVETHGPEFGEYLGGATVVDTHHGNALKTMGADEGPDRTGRLETLNHALWKALYGPSYFLVTNGGTPLETFRRAMELDDDQLVVAPYPRLDVFFRSDPHFSIGVNEELLAQLRAEHEDQSVVFYAPTWRNAFGSRNGIPLAEITPDFERVDDLLVERDAILYVSAHPREPMSIEYDRYDRVRPLENGGDLYPFLPYCDVLVTDYSSILYDFLFADEPILFYAPDLAEYESSRGLYFAYEEHVPGPVSASTDDLCEHLSSALDGTDDHGEERAERRDEFYVEPSVYPSHDAFEVISETLSDAE